MKRKPRGFVVINMGERDDKMYADYMAAWGMAIAARTELKGKGVELAPGDMVAMAATLFIQRRRF